MRRFRLIDRETDYLLPPSVQDWLPQSHLARYVVDVVEGLDLSAIEGAYAGRGSDAYHPALLLSLLIYGYATGTHSSRKIERATYDSLAFRFIACDQHPDHDTLANFRRRFGEQFAAIFVQVLQLARENQLSRFGTVSLDGTKIHANASRHSALSYGHAEKIEAQLQAEVQEMLALAEAADQSTVPEGVSLPDEIQRREDRLAAIARAKAVIEARAKARDEREQAAYQAKLAQREAQQKATGKKPGGKPPEPPQTGPRADDPIGLSTIQPDRRGALITAPISAARVPSPAISADDDPSHHGHNVSGEGRCHSNRPMPVVLTDDWSSASLCSAQIQIPGNWWAPCQ